MAPSLSALEQRQRENRAANQKVLQELGLLEPPERFDQLEFDSDYEPASDEDSDDDYGDGGRRKRKPYVPRVKISVPKNRENIYGAIDGVEVGTWWATRLECCADGVHRPTVAGIHGGADGAYSIALSGGYEDDLDWGGCFTYTGEGGRDLKGTSAQPKNLRTAPQSKDQQLTRGNLALSRNVETRTPVRVIRGYKLQSAYAPQEGYRYDGLYWVEKYWLCTGLSGFKVFKFAMKRCEDQAPPPWQAGSESGDEEKENKPAGGAARGGGDADNTGTAEEEPGSDDQGEADE